MGVSFISKTPLTKKQKIVISVAVVAAVLVFAGILTAICIIGIKFRPENRWDKIVPGTFFGELSVKEIDSSKVLQEKQKVKFVVNEITKEQHEKSNGIGTVKDVVAEKCNQDKYYKFELFVEENGEYEQLMLGKITSNYRWDVYTYEDDVNHIYLDPTPDGDRCYLLVFTDGNLQKSSYLYKGE